ncbi:hypothetical protein M9Y10_004098 [Tritrichomonas musculus]|uniref:DUF3447 domain-containing protein n=1 Tax=Tritrichomonas musculus TaxID=1915356 RepID=A0ABR2JR31_9EUKA
MEIYIEYKKKLYNTILEFLEESAEVSQPSFSQFCENMKNFCFKGNREEMRQFLLTIKRISDHHRRDVNFIQRIEKILQHYKEQIKQTLSNEEIFHIFESNKLIVLFLFKNDIITISEDIYEQIVSKIETNGNRYCHFFYPELKAYKGEEEMKSIKEELLAHDPTIFDEFERKRQEGQNDSYICSQIRKDSVEEFISYINRHNISVSSEIKPSIFETNSFLIENKNTSLIEYSAFFGSIQIFQYLLMNNVELTPSLWLYSIHSRNVELFHLLESNKIDPPNYIEEENSYLRCLIESIKCHHDDFSEYIENNLIQEQEIESTQTKEEILSNCIKYHNHSNFQADTIKEHGFFYLYFYNYKELFELLLKEKEREIEKKIILISIYFNEKMILTAKIE